jgi:O-antigen/teichoic acid export membrane protein
VLGRAEALTRNRLLAGNIALNLAGWVLPAGVALVAYPVLLRSMGAERFGLLALAWAGIGTFSVFDLGVGRALTQALAEAAARGDESGSARLTWTALWMLAPLGAACGGGLVLGAPALVERVLHVTPALRAETVTAVRLLALAIPAMVLTSALRGVLEAGQRFGVVNALRVPLAVATFAGPMAAQAVGPSLAASLVVLVTARVAVAALHWAAVARAYPVLARWQPPRAADARRLWRSAGWLTVSSVVSPVLVSADRLAVGALLPGVALAHYGTASEVATKLWLFPAAVQPVLFAALATTAAYDRERAAALFDRAMRVTLLVLAPAALVLMTAGREVLTAWMGPAMGDAAAPALRWLTAAVLVNSVAQVPYALVQGAGRADIAGKMHVIELPLFAAGLWWLTREFGIAGAAAAWFARMALDGLAFLVAAGRVVPAARAAARRAAAVTAGVAGAVALAGLPSAPTGRALAAVGVLAGLGVAARTWLVTPTEWSAVRAAASAAAARLRQRRGWVVPDRADAGD